MKLTLIGHEDRYAVEQLQMALFPEGTEGEAISTLHRGAVWLTATAKITIDGRTDLPGGDWATITKSLKRLAALEGNFWVFPGHGGSTTLRDEKKYNPYMR